MKAVITVIGQDKVGIIADVSSLLKQHNVNIIDINQTIMNDLFTMIMMVNIIDDKTQFSPLSAELEKLGNEIGIEIKITREEIYKSMHRI